MRTIIFLIRRLNSTDNLKSDLKSISSYFVTEAAFYTITLSPLPTLSPNSTYGV